MPCSCPLSHSNLEIFLTYLDLLGSRNSTDPGPNHWTTNCPQCLYWETRWRQWRYAEAKGIRRTGENARALRKRHIDQHTLSHYDSISHEYRIEPQWHILTLLYGIVTSLFQDFKDRFVTVVASELIVDSFVCTYYVCMYLCTYYALPLSLQKMPCIFLCISLF